MRVTLPCVHFMDFTMGGGGGVGNLLEDSLDPLHSCFVEPLFDGGGMIARRRRHLVGMLGIYR